MRDHRHIRREQDRSQREGEQLDRTEIASLVVVETRVDQRLDEDRSRGRAQIADARSRERREDEAVLTPHTDEKRI